VGSADLGYKARVDIEHLLRGEVFHLFLGQGFERGAVFFDEIVDLPGEFFVD
jgi:hypothetical protein